MLGYGLKLALTRAVEGFHNPAVWSEHESLNLDPYSNDMDANSGIHA